MSLNKKPYKGCRDFLPPDMRVRDYLFTKMKHSAELFAYEAYDGPLLEEVQLYKAKSGEELINEQIYSFTDRGERFVAIRPEMTPTLARMVAGVHRAESKPLRWYSIPNLMRYEKPQRGRVREHWQFNVDIFGAPEGLGEIEIIQLIITFLNSFKADSSMFSILLNDRRLVDAVFNQLLQVNKEQTYKLYKVLDKAKKVTAQKLEIMIQEILTEQSQKDILTNYLALKTFSDVENFCAKNNLTSSASGFLKFINYTKDLNIDEYIQYDPTIVRGLDYYTGIVFEIFDKHPENNRAIAGGGAYANLLKIFNEDPLPGVGFGLGDVTLKDFLQTHNLLPDLTRPDHDLLLAYFDEDSETACLQLANQLRTSGVKLELNLGEVKLKKLFKIAEKKGHSFVAMMGEDERSAGEIQVKNIISREAKKFKLTETDKIINFLNQ